MPQIFVKIISFLLVNNHPEAVIGDTEEEYLERLSDQGSFNALFWIIGQIIILVPLHYSNSLQWSIAMFRNYFKIGFRNLVKEKLISIISIAGLGFGIAAAALIIIYVHFETSYDKYHDNSDRIYRVYTKFDDSKDNNKGYGIVIRALAPALREEPSIESATSLYKFGRDLIKIDKQIYNNLNIFSADSGFFNVFTKSHIAGDLTNALSNPSSAIITEETALKFWGTTDVTGKNLEFISNFFEDRIYSVAAVIENVPANSHLEYDILLSHYSQPIFDRFGGDEFLTYFKLQEFADPELSMNLVSGIFEKVNEHRREIGYDGHAGIIPLEDIHLKGSELFRGLSGKGNLNFVYIIIIIAAAILFIAVLNFINLLSAKFQNRFNEIAVRKVVGAGRNSILSQFISEAIVIALFSAVASIVITGLTLNKFGILVNRNLEVYFNSYPWIIGGILFLSIMIAVCSAVFPALRIAKLQCVNILKNKSGGGKFSRLVPLTVMVQFAIVITLLSSIIVIYSQVQFMKEQELGFDPEQIVYFNYKDSEKYEAIKNKLEQIPEIASVSGSQSIPGIGKSGQLGKIKGFSGENISFSENRIQPGYIKTFGMKLIAGRGFKENFPPDRKAVILNEKFIRMMNLTPHQALERELEYSGRLLKIIGVVADFNFSSFEQNIGPLALTNYSDRINIMAAKIKTKNLQNTIEGIEETIKDFLPDFIYEYSFVDELFDKMYKEIEINNTLLIYSALLAIILSAMGLFAVTLFAVLRRTKEIGIRKVLGGTVSGINILLLKDYLAWVLISNIVAWPVSHYVLSFWLQNFVVKIDLHIGYYLSTGITALSIAVITIIYITTRAALNNPVNNLRYE